MTKITINRSVVEQVLEALEGGADSWQRVGPAIDALKAALAEPVQDERTTIADLRCAKWLDPECADKGACQSLKFKRSAEPVQEPAACLIGTKGSAFDSPTTKRAYTYAKQPGNVVASRLGLACNAAASQSAGDSIDRGLGLLQELQRQGFGVFDLGAEYTAPPQRPAEPDSDSPERRCGGPGCDMRCCQPVAQRGAMFHTHPAVERQRSVEAAVRPACGVDPAAKAEPVQEPQGCAHCNHPLYAAVKCKVCGRAT